MVANDRRGSGAAGHFWGNFRGNFRCPIRVTPGLGVLDPTSPRGDDAPLTIRRWTGEEFRAFAGISTKQERLLGVSTSGEPATILTTRRVMEVVGNTIRPRDVDWPRTRPILGVASILARKDDVLLGINSGEWGGGLARVDRRTGRVSYIESRTRELCGGALNGDCDPVNGIVPAPWNKDCVVIAIGLVHFLATDGSMRFVASGSENSTRRPTMSKVCRCQPHGATSPPRQWLFSA